MKISIVLGSQYGDEGKGSTTNWLTKQSKNPLVIRFNGGHQAGHTVVHNGKRHVFSSFGSGTLTGTPTFWSKYCTIFAPGFNREFDALKIKNITPLVFVDPMCPITTPYDVDNNRWEESNNSHGSCGVGFGKTIWRHETLDHSYRIFAKDLKYEWIVREKLKALSQLYPKNNKFNININSYINSIKLFLERVKIKSEIEVFSMGWDNLIFEGAQGIMLDREHGVFPNVTRSHCTSKNAIEIIERNKLWKNLKSVMFNPRDFTIYYISRCYQTRHGNGPLQGEGKFNLEWLKGIEMETNVTNEFQGEFRYAPFIFKNIDYAIDTDKQYNDYLYPDRVVVVTCMDQIKKKVPVLQEGGNVKHFSIKDFCSEFSFIGYNTMFSFDESMTNVVSLLSTMVEGIPEQ